MKRGVILLGFFFIVQYFSFAQLGIPFLKNYSLGELLDIRENSMIPMGTQYFDVVQDSRGVIYLANGGGVFEFDGNSVKYIPINNAFTLSLSIDSSGIIYVGAKFEFGYLQPDMNGRMKFVSLAGLLDEKDKPIGNIYNIIACRDGVYFLSASQFFRWYGNKITVIKSQTYFAIANFYLHQKHLVFQYGTGISEVLGDVLKMAPGGDFFRDISVITMLEFEDSTLLVGTQKNGLFIYDPFMGWVLPFSNRANDILVNNNISEGYRMPDSSFAFITDKHGLVILDKEGRLLNIFNKSSGLQDDKVNRSFTDRENGLWLALDNEVSRLEYPSPTTFFGENNGMKGSVHVVCKNRNRIYAGTSKGLYYIEANSDGTSPLSSFLPVKSLFGNEVLDILPCGDRILLATALGLDILDGETIIPIDTIYTAWCIKYSSDSSVVLAGFNKGVRIYKYDRDKKSVESKPVNTVEIPEQARIIADDGHGTVWIGTDIPKLYRLNFTSGYFKEPSVSVIDTANGVPSYVSSIAVVNGNVLLGTWYGVYRYEAGTNSFVPSDLFGKEFSDGSVDVFKIKTDRSSNVWLHADGKIIFAERQPDGVFIINSIPFLSIPNTSTNSIFIDDNGIAWFGGDAGIFRYDPAVYKNYDVPYSALVRRVSIGKDSMIFSGTFFRRIPTGDSTVTVSSLEQPDEMKFTIPYKFNNIAFEYAACSFDNASQNFYSYILEGFDDGWSPWSNEPKKSYTNLPHGHYRFRVKALNVYQVESGEGIYEFNILPPWYQTFWAYGGYVFAFLILLYTGIKINTLRLEREKRILENIVTERTAVVVRQKEEIQMQRDQIALQKQDLTDSIEYARYLQEAVLPDARQLQKLLPESFIFYRPKDIISGDFYWFCEKDGKIMVAACDCTGHGVPGALLSVLCNNLLFQAVFDHGKEEPDEILSEVNRSVLESMKKEGSTIQAEEGMDASLCVIDKKEGVVRFAGANHTLSVIRNGKIEEIRGDFTPVGGTTARNFRFSKHVISQGSPVEIIMSSDGYYSQFGGPKGKKLTRRGFKEVIFRATTQPIEKQEEIFSLAFSDWKRNFDQVDDVLVMGIKV